MFNSYSEESFIEAVKSSISIREVLTKLNVKAAGGNYRTAHKYIKILNLDISHFKGQGWNKNNFGPKQDIELYLSNIKYIQSNKLKKRLIREEYKEHKCEVCKLTEWQDKPIPIELHHKDGNHLNNNLDNLQILCANCHHQTNNFRRNKTENKKESAAKLNNFIRPKKQYFCLDCKKKCSKSAIRCKSCSQIIKCAPNRKRPEKEQLIIDLLEFKNNYSAVARKYSASQTAVRKWVDFYNL